MFARTTSMQLKIAFIEDALAVYKNSIVPAAQSQKGLIELSLFLDRKSGKAVSIAIWETEQDAKANEESHYYQEQLVKLMSYYANPPVKEGFEVYLKE
jgi:heme-degrading monooxygenase HmoA